MVVEHGGIARMAPQDTKIMRSWVKTTHYVHGNMGGKCPLLPKK